MSAIIYWKWKIINRVRHQFHFTNHFFFLYYITKFRIMNEKKASLKILTIINQFLAGLLLSHFWWYSLLNFTQFQAFRNMFSSKQHSRCFIFFYSFNGPCWFTGPAIMEYLVNTIFPLILIHTFWLLRFYTDYIHTIKLLFQREKCCHTQNRLLTLYNLDG